jgi:putative ABC transport system substrate-binding protein
MPAGGNPSNAVVRISKEKHDALRTRAKRSGRVLWTHFQWSLGDQMVDRRAFIGIVAAGLLVEAHVTSAQQPRKIPVIGILHSTPDSSASGQTVATFRRGLRDLGYVEGQDILLEYRSAAGGQEQLPVHATELVRRSVDVIYAIGPTAVQAARNATAAIPIVAIDLESDPVASGLVRSLNRPGGNLTGLFLDLPELTGKWLQLLREAVPRVKEVGVLWDAGTGSTQLAALKVAARGIAITLQVLEFRGPDDLNAALEAGLSGGVKALVVLSSPVMFSLNSTKRVGMFAMANRLPTIAPTRRIPDAGGLMSYGPDLAGDLYRRAAPFVDRILKGAKPADLPVEQPKKFELVINLSAAKALGLTVPQSLLLRADEVIQ